ncbi:MAG: HlyD family efflux transporter periplasmic adaptor subunit [Bryobacteraceae bacterium]
MRGKWVLLSLSLILVAVAAGALSLLRKDRPQAVQAPEPAAALPPPIGNEVSLTGVIQPREVVTVGPAVAGVLESIAVDAGDFVFQGQILAQISNESLSNERMLAEESANAAQARVNAIESAMIAARLEASRASADASRSRDQYETAQRYYQRQRLLLSEGATPRLTFEKAQREFENAEREYRSLDDLSKLAQDRVAKLNADLEAARIALRDRNNKLEEAQTHVSATEIRSPVDGVLVGRNKVVQERVGPEDEDLLQIATDLSSLEVVLRPDPRVLRRLRPGQQALVIIADMGGQGLPGSVSQVGDPEVKVFFANPNPNLRLGATAQVRILLEPPATAP